MKLIPLEELAEILSVDKSWLYRHMYHLRGVKPIKVGKYCRFDEQAVHEWINRGCELDVG